MRRKVTGAVMFQDFEKLFSEHCPFLDRKACRYTVEKGRESTARVVVWREFGVKRSFTMESTYCGFNKAKHKVRV